VTSGESSCRPARLERFDATVGALCDGLGIRAGLLDDALAAYRSSCDPSFRAPTAESDEMVRAVASALRDLGQWAGAVGAAFRRAAEAEGLPGWFGLDGELTLADARIEDGLGGWSDPYRGVAEGTASQLARDLGVDDDPDGPPAWVELVGDGTTVTDVLGPLLAGTALGLAGLPPGVAVTLRVEAGAVAVLADDAVVTRLSRSELSARLMLPTAGAPRVAAAATWVGRAGSALAFLAGGGEQWHADGGLPASRRVARAVTRGGGVAALSAGAGAAGVEAGAVCGPFMPVCSTVFGIGGAIAGGIAGGAIVDALPWMEPPPPGEHDLGIISHEIAADDGRANARLGAQADLTASDLAVLATADDPHLSERVMSVLPDDDVLERIVAYDERSAPPWVPAGTTTTSTTAPSPPAPGRGTGGAAPPPDPWAGDWAAGP
jgi:hypothetical protein